MTPAQSLKLGAVVAIRGEQIHLRPERAMWWPRRGTLVVADLHVGKEASFIEHGIALPTRVMSETLERLERVLAVTRATRLVVLGDLVHRPAGLTDEVVDAFTRWRSGFDGEFELIPGNHDDLIAHLPSSWRVTRMAATVLDPPFVHMHDAAPHADGYALGGHLHPVVHLEGRVDRLTLPCFVIGSRRAVLPAFTRFSRGVRMARNGDDRLHAIVDDSVVEVPSSSAPG